MSLQPFRSTAAFVRRLRACSFPGDRLVLQGRTGGSSATAADRRDPALQNARHNRSRDLPALASPVRHSWPSLSLLLPAGAGCAVLLLGAAIARAQVVPGGLRTRVNGVSLGACTAGVCRVQGGTATGRTLFHRFGQFDTRSGIRRVDLDTRGKAHVVVGVGHPDGSFFDAPLRLSESADLFLLAPGGVWFGPGGTIQGARNLLLSSAPTLRIGNGTFSAAGSLVEGPGDVGRNPRLRLAALEQGNLAEFGLASGDGPIVLAGGRLTVDRHLLLHSGAGPIRSDPAGEQRLGLQAGRSVQLSGVGLQLRGLAVQAGGGADDRVSLRSGSLREGDPGHLQLAEASLRGSRVELESAGALTLEGVAAHAGGLAGTGAVQLSAGTERLEAPVRLNGVSLRGGAVLVRAGGSLVGRDLRAQAGTSAGSGLLQLEAGPGAVGTPSLLLERVDLQGRAVVIRSAGAGELRQGVIHTQPPAAPERPGDPAELWIGTAAGPAGSASPLALTDVRLSGRKLVVAAAGDLQARGLQAQAGDLWLVTQAGSEGNLRVAGGAVRVDGALGVQSAGHLELGELVSTADEIAVQAAGRLRLHGVQMQTPAATGSIRLSALNPDHSAQRGHLSIGDSHLEGQTIVGRADQSLQASNLTAVAGAPGRRGLIQLETSPAEEPPQGHGSGFRGTLHLRDADLQGQRVALRSGRIDVAVSRIAAPKGQIHLEAKAGDLAVSASTFDLAAATVPDLRMPVIRRETIDGVSIEQIFPTPSIGFFSAADILIRDHSEISAGQELAPLFAAHPRLQRSQIRLTDTSGLVAIDAASGLTVSNSRISANASHNLAGNVLLRAQSLDGKGTLALVDSTLEASNGAGSGDLRLHSANGMKLVRSRLSAHSVFSPEDPHRPGRSDWSRPIQGGEITLTNTSGHRPIILAGSQLRAEQTASQGLLLTTVLDGSNAGQVRPDFFHDDYDASDRLTAYGGIVSMISAGGMRFQGPRARVSVDSAPPGPGPAESLGGTIRVVNLSSSPIRFQTPASFSTITAPALSPEIPSRAGELFVVGSVAEMPPIRALWGAGRSANPHILRPDAISEDHLFVGRSYRYRGGLTQEIRDRIQPAAADVVMVAGGDPVTLSSPSPPALQVADLPGRSVKTAVPPGPVAAFRWAGGTEPATVSTRLASPITLAQPADAAPDSSSLNTVLTQAMSPEAAVRSLQATDLAAARAASAAFGLPFADSRRLEVSSLQRILANAMDLAGKQAGQAGSPSYRPAILQISATVVPGTDQLQINHILIPGSGEIKGWQSRLERSAFQQQLKAFQQQLSQGGGLGSRHSGEQLSAVLLHPVLEELRRQEVSSLLLSLDRGLQGIPFAALPVAGGLLLDEMAVTVTPALALLDFDSPGPSGSRPRVLLAGASHFSNGLAPLPMAVQELRQVAALHPGSQVLLDGSFNREGVIRQMEANEFNILHLATHADFAGNLIDQARIYTNHAELPLQELASQLRRADRQPISLFVLNGCRTAIGNEDQELGISGLALQANSQSALGNLWYVDDVVTAAFSVQFHRSLQLGLAKDEALRQTQLLFRQGRISVRGPVIADDRGEVLISGLSRADQARLGGRLADPYFWAGAVLSGRPW
jgi:CHAT domain-containing protein